MQMLLADGRATLRAPCYVEIDEEIGGAKR
jgi:hypothetical protein